MAKYLMQTALGAVLATAAFSTPALSQSVVDELIAKMTTAGATVTFDKAEEGDTTTWNNLVATEPGGDGVITIDWVREVQSGDAYTITMAPSAEMTFDADGDEGALTITNDGLAYLVNRAGGGLSMAYSASSIGLSMMAGPELQDFSVTFSNVSGNDTIEGAEWASGSGQMQAGAMGMNIGVDDGDVVMTVDQEIADVSITYAFDGFAGNMENPEALLGGLFQFTLQSGSNSGSGTFGEAGQNVSLTFSGGPTDASFDMSDGSISYSGSASEISYSVNPTAMGFPPVDLSLQAASFAFGMPIAQTDEAVDVQYMIQLLGLEVSEGLWRMVDPSQTIPRDPADIVIDLAATAKWLISPADLAEGEPDAMPIEFEDVQVNEIRVSIGGAEISANGSATIMNGGPFPLPVGRLDIAINGVNGLVDKLTSLGLLTPDMVLPVRALMGVYTTPVGDDQMTSSVEMTADGQVLANGLPLPN